MRERRPARRRSEPPHVPAVVPAEADPAPVPPAAARPGRRRRARLRRADVAQDDRRLARRHQPAGAGCRVGDGRRSERHAHRLAGGAQRRGLRGAPGEHQRPAGREGHRPGRCRPTSSRSPSPSCNRARSTATSCAPSVRTATTRASRSSSARRPARRPACRCRATWRSSRPAATTTRCRGPTTARRRRTSCSASSSPAREAASSPFNDRRHHAGVGGRGAAGRHPGPGRRRATEKSAFSDPVSFTIPALPPVPTTGGGRRRCPAARRPRCPAAPAAAVPAGRRPRPPPRRPTTAAATTTTTPSPAATDELQDLPADVGGDARLGAARIERRGAARGAQGPPGGRLRGPGRAAGRVHQPGHDRQAARRHARRRPTRARRAAATSTSPRPTRPPPTRSAPRPRAARCCS